MMFAEPYVILPADVLFTKLKRLAVGYNNMLCFNFVIIGFICPVSFYTYICGVLSQDSSYIRLPIVAAGDATLLLETTNLFITSVVS